MGLTSQLMVQCTISVLQIDHLLAKLEIYCNQTLCSFRARRIVL